MAEGARYRTTAPHFLPDGVWVAGESEIGYGTQYPLPEDWKPSMHVVPLNDAAEAMIKKTPYVNVAPVDENGFILPQVKNDPTKDVPDAGKPKDPASTEEPPKPDTSTAPEVKPIGKGK